MSNAIQMPCQSRKTAKKGDHGHPVGTFRDQDLAESANDELGTFAKCRASNREGFGEEYE
jgi:hypothetical protein